MLTKRQFDSLLLLMESKEKVLSQRKIAEALNTSLGTINTCMKELEKNGLINDKTITTEGLAIMEDYRVKRVIILAAGFATRLIPLSINTPTSLIHVHGKRIVDTCLDAILAAEIDEIYIVTGYLKENFTQLLTKYPTIKLIENEDYNNGGSIRSLLCASKYLDNTYIMDADLIIKNPKIIKKYQYQSNFLGVPIEKTDDWCFATENKKIVNISRGGKNRYLLVPISYWSSKDSKGLKLHLQEHSHLPGGKESNWEEVPINFYKDYYDLSVEECSSDDYIEIDTLNELKQVDSIYNI